MEWKKIYMAASNPDGDLDTAHGMANHKRACKPCKREVLSVAH